MTKSPLCFSHAATSLGVLLAGLVLAPGSAVAASTALVDIPPGHFADPKMGFDETHGNGMVGWLFRVTTTITITQVGWYDFGGDGLSRSFQVGLWQDPSGGHFAPGTPVVSYFGDSGIQIPAGTEASLAGTYRVIDLPAPIVLQPGSYQLGGLDTSVTTDPIRFFFDGATGGQFTDTGYDIGDVKLGAFFYAVTTGFRPGFHAANSSEHYTAFGMEIGPMIFVPEPSSSLLILVGAGLVCRRRRNR